MGQVPPFERGWRSMGVCKDAQGLPWGVFVQDQEHSEAWKTLKVAALAAVSSKANYWVAFNVRTGQIGFARDYSLMRKNRPELHERVEALRYSLSEGIENGAK